MTIKINGDDKIINENLSLQELFNSLEIKTQIMASAINMKVIKKDKWDITILKNNDEVEFLQFVGGG
jgi:sulfur carrier protein